MPKFDKDNRVYTDSLIQIFEGINDTVGRFAKGKIRFGPKKKVNKARLLNALFLWFLRQDSDVQETVIGSVMPLLYEHHEATERIEIGQESVPTAITWSVANNRQGNVTMLEGNGLDEVRPANRRKRPQVRS